MNIQVKEYILAVLIIGTFITYYFDLLKDGMMVSGIFAVVILLYVGLIWAEKIQDERDEYIRSKVDRSLYILTLLLLLTDIIYKTLTHQGYMSAVMILTVLSLVKILLSKFIKNTN
jgi:hypothetical protein